VSFISLMFWSIMTENWESITFLMLAYYVSFFCFQNVAIASDYSSLLLIALKTKLDFYIGEAVFQNFGASPSSTKQRGLGPLYKLDSAIAAQYNNGRGSCSETGVKWRIRFHLF